MTTTNQQRLDGGQVVCPACGSLHEPAGELLRGLREDLENLERELRSKRARIKTLQREQDEALRASPHYPDALAVLEFWRDQCYPAAKELGGKRVEAVIARLKHHTPSELRLAVEGYAKFPYVVDGKRSPVGIRAQWYADAETIFANEKRVAWGIDMAVDKGEVRIPPTVFARTPWRLVREANRRAIEEMLIERFGDPLREDGFALFPCPRCDNEPALTLRVASLGYHFLAECSSCGINDEQLLAHLPELADG